MQPHIAPSDVVVVSKFSVHSPVPGVQIGTADTTRTGQAQILILHRITAAHEDGTYTTTVDANANADLNPLHREQISGVGRLLVPYIGLPSLWWNTGNYVTMGSWMAATLLALIAVTRSRIQNLKTVKFPSATCSAPVPFQSLQIQVPRGIPAPGNGLKPDVMPPMAPHWLRSQAATWPPHRFRISKSDRRHRAGRLPPGPAPVPC